MSAADYASDVKDLFVLPDVYLRLQELIEDKSATIDDFADVIALDTTLSAKVLKLANSALYNFAGKIGTLSQAINLIGSQALCNLALANGAANAFSATPDGVIDLQRFWKESVECALIARNLAAKFGKRQTEPYFIMGLLHNIGELVVAAVDPEQATQCESVFSDQETNHPRYLIQKEHVGYTYAEIGSALLSQWQLPEELIEPIAQQNAPDENQDCSINAALLSLAIALSQFNNDDEGFDPNSDVSIPESLSEKLSVSDINEALEYANLEAFEVLAILNPVSSFIY